MNRYLRGNMLFVLIVMAVVLGLSLPVPIQASIINPPQTLRQDSYTEPYIEYQNRIKTNWGYEYTLHSSDIVEVGDKTTQDFKPHIKLGRWDNEVWFSLYYPTIVKTPAIEVDANKISWNTPSTGFNFYSLEPTDLQGSKQNEKGGFEFEIILYEKPLFNTINLNIMSSGLDFYRQSPLSTKYKSGWSERWQDTITVTETTVMGTKSENPLAYRPENVVGSYAVYHSIKGGMNLSNTEAEKYKAGKAFHIYRPLVNGEIWADLYIDQVAGQLSIIIPQSYIDDLKNYPMVIDPNFGVETIGGSSAAIEDIIAGIVGTCGGSGTLDSVTAYNDDWAGNYKYAVYTTAGSKVDDTVEATAAEGGGDWYTLNVTTGSAVSAQNYVVVGWSNHADTWFFYDTVVDAERADSKNYVAGDDNFPASVTFDTDDYKWSVYATYTAGGVSAPTVVSNAATSVEETTATLSGNITATGGENPNRRGFKWDIDTGEPYADNWTESGNFSVGNFTHGITGLTKGELYYSIATANNSGGWGSGSEITFLTKPDEPNTLVATAGDEEVSLTWVKGTGAQKTYIRGKADSYPANRADGYEVYDDTGTSTTDTGLSNNTTYYYRAWSYATEGAKEQYSDAYDQDSATPVSGVSAPTVVTNAATSVEETTATLSGNITATGGENPDHRGFYYDTDNTSPPWANNWIESGNFTVGNFTRDITGLTRGEWYQYIASANNSGGSANGTVEYFLTKPDPPNTLTVTDQGSAWISISWVKGTGTDNTTVNYRTDQTPTDPDDGTASYNGTGTTDNITGLSAGQIYYIAAWSQCWEGVLSQSSDVSDNLTDYTLPGDPSNLTTDNVTATSIEMTWAKGTGGDYTEIRRKAGSNPANVADGTQSYYNTGTSDNDTGLDKGTTYFYRAWARDTDSNYYSAGYTQSSNTTSTTVPTVTNNGGATNITDNASRLRGEITDTGGDNPTTYVYWGLTDGSENVTAWANEENLGVQTANFYFDSSNLTASTMYFYRCKAINGQGTDWANSTANFTTLSEGFAIGAPTNITITDHGAITVEFNWAKGVDSTYTMIRAGRTEYPASTTEGELIYYGDNTTCNITGFSLLTTNYKVTLWGFHSDNSTYSSNVTTGNIGGEDMEAVADEIGALATALGTFSAFTSGTVTQVFTLLLCVAITGLAFWRNNVFLYLLAAPVDLVYGLSFAAGSTPGSDAWVEGVIVAIIGTFCLFKVVVEQFIAQVSRKGVKKDG